MTYSSTTLNAIEVALAKERTVLDCAVRARSSEKGDVIVAYVVPTGSFVEQTARTNLQSDLPGLPLPEHYVQLSALPFTMTGIVDDEALARFEIVDEGVAKEWEQKLLSVPGVERAAVLIEQRAPKLSALHLSDLLPSIESSEKQEGRSVAASSSEVKQQWPKEKKPAISHGGPLSRPKQVPQTLQRALEHAAETKPPRTITYVQADGSEIVQTYRQLLEDSQRILGGLRSLGLQPGDKVIFQLDRNQDFIPAFWACVLGGFVPAPISIAPSYSELNSTVHKLHNSWEMLEHPVILAGQNLAHAVRNLGELLGLENVRVETVERLRTFAADRDWHASEPEDVCLILLTSGSTGLPKGVLQSHRALMHRSAGTAELTQFESNDVLINWFPLDHVGGIVMSHLMALFGCASQVHIPTDVILQEPLKWLDAIERHRATVTWAPNFAFGLINDQPKQLDLRQWDLSSMRFILNGGEAVVPKTTRRFLRILAKHGLRPDAVHPAWGMSETCSGVAYSERCSRETIRDEDLFVEVGLPIPGVSFRIVDGRDQLLEERQIGRLQVTGLPVTTGYYKNPELNRESFSSDGWFNTGDVAMLNNGRLTITGRSKDAIIVNGANFFSHELEAVVEEVAGVDVSYTAAFAVRVVGDNTDRLCVVFHALMADWGQQLAVIKRIRETLVKKAGIKPAYIIPVERSDIPKTAIGKIQRSKLRERFEAGEFRELLKRIDLQSANANTLPNWFHEEVWVHRERAVPLASPEKGTYLIFADEMGVAEQLSRALSDGGSRCALVRAGCEFVQSGHDEYRLNPPTLSDYQQLVEALLSRGLEIDHLVHLWSYCNLPSACTSTNSLRAAQDRGTYSVLSLLHALANGRNPSKPLRLFVVTSNAQITSSDQKTASPEFSTVSGLLLTAQLELPWLECRHVDLESDSPETNAERIAQELTIKLRKSKVAYRGGRRLEGVLASVDMLQGVANSLPIVPGGLYLITGGLGGLGVVLARHLAGEYCAKLVLAGRTPLPIEADGPYADGLLAQRMKDYSAIRKASPESRYEVLDVADLAKVRKCIADAENRSGQPLAGIFHLAGSLGHAGTLKHHWDSADDHLIKSEKKESFEEVYHSKVYGTWALFEAIRERPEILFVAFSSLNALFGGGTLSAYSAANAFLRNFCLQKKYSSHPRTFCFDWSMWDELGMSKESPEYARELAVNMGFHIIQKEQGIHSMLAGLRREHGSLSVGLDPCSPRLRGHLHTDVYPLARMAAFCVAKDGALTNGDLERLRNSEPMASDSRLEMIPEMPLTENNEIDKDKLLCWNGSTGNASEEAWQQQSETARRVAKSWKEVLNVPHVRADDTFFGLGGDSLTAMRLVNQLRETFGVHLSVRDLFEMRTIPRLALAIEQGTCRENDAKSQSKAEHRQPSAQELLNRIDEIPDSQVEALLQEMTGNEFTP